MQKDSNETSEKNNGIRLLDGSAFLLHHRHIQSDPGTRRWDCGFCGSGLSGVVKVIEVPIPEPEVVQSDGTDEEEDSSSPSPREWPW